MTFCYAARVNDGVVGFADTRVTSGVERTTARKMTLVDSGRHSMFVMTSGLRSLRDKAMTYFEAEVLPKGSEFTRMYQAVNALAEQVRRVSQEDRAALAEVGLGFDVAALVGGQMAEDPQPTVYLLYPEGNWVEVTYATPYLIIGESRYGKPLCDRILTAESSLKEALVAGFLAFDATKTSATDVDYPLDAVVVRTNEFKVMNHRYTREDLQEASTWWQKHVRDGVGSVPSDWTKSLLD